MDDTDDPFEILGLPPDASETDIKKAYKKLALKHHPDKQTNDVDREKANAVFAKISNAYQILTDEQLRRKFEHQKRKEDVAAASPRPTRTRYYKVPKEEAESEFTVKPPFMSSFNSNNTKYSPEGRKSTFRQSTTTSTDGTTSFSFTFSSDDMDANFEDPFEMFKKMFREENGPDFNLTEVLGTTGSPLFSTRKTAPNTVSTSTVRKTPSSMPRRKTSKSPSRRSKRSPLGNSFKKLSLEEPSSDDSPVVSMSTKTRQIQNTDGSVETITETTKTYADGSTSTQRESSTSVSTPTSGSYKTSSSTPMRVQTKQAPTTIKVISSGSSKSPRVKRETMTVCN